MAEFDAQGTSGPSCNALPIDCVSDADGVPAGVLVAGVGASTASSVILAANDRDRVVTVGVSAGA